MESETITKQHLEQFREQLTEQLVQEFKNLLASKQAAPPRKWLKSYEVRKMLNISQGTLQNLRLNGSLSYSKVGSSMFYNYEEIERLMEEGRIGHSKH